MVVFVFVRHCARAWAFVCAHLPFFREVIEEWVDQWTGIPRVHFLDLLLHFLGPRELCWGSLHPQLLVLRLEQNPQPWELWRTMRTKEGALVVHRADVLFILSEVSLMMGRGWGATLHDQSEVGMRGNAPPPKRRYHSCVRASVLGWPGTPSGRI